MKITHENIREHAGKLVNYYGDRCYLVAISLDEGPDPSVLIVSETFFEDSWGYRGLWEIVNECREILPGCESRIEKCSRGYYVLLDEIALYDDETIKSGRVKVMIPQQPQSQASLSEQLQELTEIANRMGLYDAADYLGKVAK